MRHASIGMCLVAALAMAGCDAVLGNDGYTLGLADGGVGGHTAADAATVARMKFSAARVAGTYMLADVTGDGVAELLYEGPPDGGDTTLPASWIAAQIEYGLTRTSQPSGPVWTTNGHPLHFSPDFFVGHFDSTLRETVCAHDHVTQTLACFAAAEGGASAADGGGGWTAIDEQPFTPLSGATSEFAVVDLDGDGVDELLEYDATTASKMLLYRWTAGRFESDAALSRSADSPSARFDLGDLATACPHVSAIHSGNFYGDPSDDLVVECGTASDSAHQLEVYENVHAPGHHVLTRRATLAVPQLRAVAFGNFDGREYDEAFIYDPADSTGVFYPISESLGTALPEALTTIDQGNFPDPRLPGTRFIFGMFHSSNIAPNPPLRDDALRFAADLSVSDFIARYNTPGAPPLVYWWEANYPSSYLSNFFR